MKNTLPLSGLLTYQETAAFLNTSESSIRRFLQNDPTFPPPIRMGLRLVRFSKVKLEKWLELQSKCA
jgi:predicted DNA-binding transcriptional regulator AlpA